MQYYDGFKGLMLFKVLLEAGLQFCFLRGTQFWGQNNYALDLQQRYDLNIELHLQWTSKIMFLF